MANKINRVSTYHLICYPLYPMQKITLWRPSLSTYFNESYLKEEKKLADQLGFTYHFSKVQPEGPTILLSNTHLDQFFYNNLSSNCQLIIHPNSGHDGIPFQFVKKSPAPILLGNPIRANAVAEYVLWAIARTHFYKEPKKKKWDKLRSFDRSELATKKIQLIGHGHVGRILEKKLCPLFSTLWISDPLKKKNELHFKEADIIILCCELTPQNKYFFNKEIFSELKSNVHIINPARGGLIKESELLKFLKKNKDAHATIDVFESEPKDFSLFKDFSNLTATSHVAGVFDGLAQTQLHFIQNILENYLKLKLNIFLNKYEALHLQKKGTL